MWVTLVSAFSQIISEKTSISCSAICGLFCLISSHSFLSIDCVAKKVLAENLKQKAHKEAKIVADAKSLAEALKALEIKITAKAGGDKLFGSVTSANIVEALEANGHSIDKKFITSGVVKRVGKYTASVRLHRDVIVELAYEIVGEKA